MKQWPRIDLVVFDFDGVMTNNKVIVGQDGSEYVQCHRGDGLGVSMLRKHFGADLMILSTETNQIVQARGKKLGIPTYNGIQCKASFLSKYMKEQSIDPKNVAYVGNDVNDLECMRMVGLPACPADAVKEIRDVSIILLDKAGGEGAVREFADLLIRHQTIQRGQTRSSPAGGGYPRAGPGASI